MSRFRESPSITVEPQGPPKLSFEPFLPAYILFGLALLLVISAVRSYARSTRPLSTSRRLVLWILRASAAMVVLLCLSRPILVQATGLREKGLCMIALDASSSMNLRDVGEKRTRWETAGHLFAEHQKELSQLGSRFEIRRFVFDARPRETSQLPGEQATKTSGRPDGRATDLTELLRRLLSDGGGTPCAGVLLISDGRHNGMTDPIPVARLMDKANVPLFIVGVGQEATPEDYREVQIKVLDVPERGFVGSKLMLRIEVESTVRQGAMVPLKVEVNGKTIATRSIELAPGSSQVARVEVPYKPSSLGIHRIVASVPPLPKEANVNNNRRTAYLRVYQTKLGVWYVEGAIRKEFGAIRSALETAPNVNMQALNAFVRGRGPEKDLLPQTEEGWSDLRLVIIGDMPRNRFAHDQLVRLARFVDEGGALLMIGGVETFGAGGWHHTRVSPVLPVEMSWGDGAVEGALRISLTDQGRQHTITQIAENPVRSLEVWGKLPTVPGLNKVAGIRPAARVLLKADDYPLLVVQNFGKGRSAAYLGEKTWQWSVKAGQGDGHKRFWRNLVTWLTRSAYRDADQVVFVETERLQYLVGDEVALNARVQETESTKGKVARASVMASLEVEGGERKSWELGVGKGTFVERFVPKEAGSYTFEVQVMGGGGKALGRDEVRFQVEALDVENDNPKANLRLLQRLSMQSGGIYFDTQHASEAFNHLLRRPAGYVKTVREIKELWNNWTLFVVFVILLGVEWTLRKRWGLV